MVGFVLGTLGYPFCLTLSTSIFSKITMQYRAPVSWKINFSVFEAIDSVFIPIFQATWLGNFATSGSVARVVGPLLITELYSEFGTYVMLAIVAATLGLAFILVLVFWKFLVPKYGKKKTDEEGHVKNGEDDMKTTLPEIHINNAVIEEEEDEMETVEENDKDVNNTTDTTVVPGDVGRKLIIYDE